MGSLWIVRNKKVKTQVVEHKVVSIDLRKWPAIENVHLWAVVVQRILQAGNTRKTQQS